MTLTEKADKVFSLWIRNHYATHEGYVTCYTCKRQYPIADMQCGHFNSRQFKAVRWHEDNARPQCYNCNVTHSGRFEAFKEELEDEIGEEEVAEIIRKAKEDPYPDEEEIKKIIEKYTLLLKKMGVRL